MIVHWEGQSQAFPLTLPAENAAGKLAFTIESEDQSQTVSQTYDLAKLDREPSSLRSVSDSFAADSGMSWAGAIIRFRSSRQIANFGRC